MSADLQRRAWLSKAAALPLAAALPAAALAAQAEATVAAAPWPQLPAGTTPAALAGNQSYWSSVAALYDMADQAVLLDNGFWGSMARPVLQAYEQHTAEINRGNSWYVRREFAPQYEAARRRAAAALGVEPDEIVFTRGATEALQVLIGGYNRLDQGDVVLYADTDYDSMISAMQWLRTRRGAEPVALVMPDPPTHDAILALYARAIESQPRLKLILLTHVSHRHGLVLPVADISAMARRRGIDVIVDTAHGYGQLDMRIPDLQADFVGINLHKWIGAPIGVGAVYIKRGRVADIDPYMGEREGGPIATRVHTGTVNFAAYLALPVALDLHERIGVANKQARLALLRNRWVDAAREINGIEVLASSDPRLSSAIASFRLKGRTSRADNIALARRLLDQHGVFTVERDGLASGACVRVTPSVFTSEADIDRLISALRQVASGA